MLVEKAKEFAFRIHSGQKDKAGAPYSEHLSFVADQLTGETERCVAYLHDTLEDTETTESDLRKLFGDEVADAVVALTRKEDEPYFDFILRAGRNPLAAAVKMADLSHNMMIDRIDCPTEKDKARVQKYKKAYELLSAAIHRQNPLTDG